MTKNPNHNTKTPTQTQTKEEWVSNTPAWSIKDELRFIEGLGKHTAWWAAADENTETLLNKYRLALTKRAAQGYVGFNAKDALLVIDKRLAELKIIRQAKNNGQYSIGVAA